MSPTNCSMSWLIKESFVNSGFRFSNNIHSSSDRGIRNNWKLTYVIIINVKNYSSNRKLTENNVHKSDLKNWFYLSYNQQFIRNKKVNY